LRCSVICEVRTQFRAVKAHLDYCPIRGETMNASSHQSSQGGWVVNYTQSDVDTIREQIEQTQAAKRRWLVLALIIIIAALVGAVALLTTSYALYAGSESDKKRLTEENGALKTTLEQTRQQLDTYIATSQKEAQSRADAQARLDRVRSAISVARASDADIAGFARMVSELPQGKIELDEKPPDRIFRNWKVKGDSGTEVYTLVGGFVDGKWVIHSNLVARAKPGS
jgi:cell division protein FtsB